jgi:glyoxylase-like metal-dependent hydrolase (beta-lactamase superfamily II)
MKLLRNVYWYPYRGFRNNGNTCVFTGQKSALVDPGQLFNLEHLMTAIQVDALRLGDIEFIIISHGHPDHFEAAARLKEITHAKIAIHSIERDHLTQFAMFGSLPRLNVDVTLSDELDLGGVTLQILHTPGHSPGSISVYWPEEKVLVVGDVVFNRGMGRTDLPGGDLQQLKRSILMLSELDVEYLLPGHHYGFPPDHSGIIKGRENVQRNFAFLKTSLGI